MQKNLSNNILHVIIEKWWLHHKETIDSVARLSSEKIVEQILSQLESLKKSSNIEQDAEIVPLSILDYAATLCDGKADLLNQKRCAAAICQVLSICITLLEDYQLKDAQGELQIKIREYESDKKLQDDFWDYISPEQLEPLKSFLKDTIFDSEKEKIIIGKVKALMELPQVANVKPKSRHAWFAVLGCWLYENNILKEYGHSGFNVSAFAKCLTDVCHLKDVQVKYINDTLKSYRQNIEQKDFTCLHNDFSIEYDTINKL